MRIFITLTFFLALCTGIILLQIFLSKKENKWLGLILPIISFCISLIAVLNIAAYTTNTVTGVLQVTDENGVVIQEEVVPEAPSTTQPIQNIPSLIFTVGAVLLLYNIPTVVLLAIYFGCREKQRKRKALDKMQAQDLE